MTLPRTFCVPPSTFFLHSLCRIQIRFDSRAPLVECPEYWNRLDLTAVAFFSILLFLPFSWGVIPFQLSFGIFLLALKRCKLLPWARKHWHDVMMEFLPNEWYKAFYSIFSKLNAKCTKLFQITFNSSSYFNVLQLSTDFYNYISLNLN